MGSFPHYCAKKCGHLRFPIILVNIIIHCKYFISEVRSLIRYVKNIWSSQLEVLWWYPLTFVGRKISISFDPSPIHHFRLKCESIKLRYECWWYDIMDCCFSLFHLISLSSRWSNVRSFKKLVLYVFSSLHIDLKHLSILGHYLFSVSPKVGNKEEFKDELRCGENHKIRSSAKRRHSCLRQ